ncbi:MAG: SCO family protein, partial [Desulfuromonadales bacterium]|nr:SCO family protein [Desulfuromonadales bacterium]
PEVPPEHQHEGHGDSPEEHVHPVPTPTGPATEIGLEERLGEYIPLDLQFRDETGQPVTLGELIDTPTIIAPVYYRCPNVCNFLQSGLAQVLPKVSLQPGGEYRVLSISFDETEDPDLARRSKNSYYTAMGGNYPPEAWRFLTGEATAIRQLTDSLGYHFQRQGVDFLHPVVVAVVAPDGKIVRYLHGTRFLPMDVTLALVEASQGKVGSTIKRIVSFCFSYDAENRRYVFNLLRVTAVVVLLTAGSFLAYLLLSGRKKKNDGRIN